MCVVTFACFLIELINCSDRSLHCVYTLHFIYQIGDLLTLYLIMLGVVLYFVVSQVVVVEVVAVAAAAVDVDVVDIDVDAAGAAFPHITRVCKIYLPLCRLSVLKYVYVSVRVCVNSLAQRNQIFLCTSFRFIWSHTLSVSTLYHLTTELF